MRAVFMDSLADDAVDELAEEDGNDTENKKKQGSGRSARQSDQSRGGASNKQRERERTLARRANQEVLQMYMPASERETFMQQSSTSGERRTAHPHSVRAAPAQHRHDKVIMLFVLYHITLVHSCYNMRCKQGRNKQSAAASIAPPAQARTTAGLHPSWAAKVAAKEKLQSVQPFEGKKIIFSDD